MEATAAYCPVPVIAIDGPTASGKGTIAQHVAKNLGFHYLDSGILYRAVAYSSLKADILANDEPSLIKLAQHMHIKAEDKSVWLNNEEVSLSLRDQRCGQRASEIAVLPGIRQSLLVYQRGCMSLPGLVADGRDMGSVVFPDATLKIFLTASAEVRAYRRFRQLLEQGFSANLSQIAQEISVRDQRDSGRSYAPLCRAPGAWLLDTSGLTIDQVVKKIVNRYHRNKG